MKLLKKNETEKKRKYSERVTEVEHGTFTPLVFSTNGIVGEETDKFFKELALKLSDKIKQSYAECLSYIRTRIRFALLRSSLIALRGARSKCGKCAFEDHNLHFV